MKISVMKKIAVGNVKEYIKTHEALKSYDLNNIALCGHSMGGLIAIDMLINHNYPAKSLILLNSIYPIKVSKFLIEKAKINTIYTTSYRSYRSPPRPLRRMVLLLRNSQVVLFTSR